MLLVEDWASETVINKLDGFNANVVTLTVGDELSGEIAQFVAGEASIAAADKDEGDEAKTEDE
jgi:hypothetical protein